MNFRKRHALIGKCHTMCVATIDLVERKYGETHLYKRASEIYEKAAITGILCKEDSDYVLYWSATAVAMLKCSEPELSLYTARALGVLSEAQSYAGELEQAIETADEGGRMAIKILGNKSGRAKKMARLKGEHRKLYMKCSAAGFSVQAMRVSARKMMLGRVDQPQWMRSWVIM